MADEKSPVPTPPASLKKDTLSEPAEDKKFVVVEDEIAPEVEPIVVEEVAPKPVAVVEEVAPSSEVVVDVYEKNIIFENRKNKKSMSVWQVQRRLNDLGYESIRLAQPGYYDHITLATVETYRAEKKLGSGAIDAKFLKALFAGDKSVKLILS